MNDVGGIWNPWNTRNEKASCKSSGYPDIDAAIGNIVPPQSPALALAGSERGKPDYEAAIAMAMTILSMGDSDDIDVFTHAVAQTDEWRLLVSSIAAKAEDGSAREALEHARKAWRGGLS